MPEGQGQRQLRLPQGLFLSSCSMLAEHNALYSQGLTHPGTFINAMSLKKQKLNGQREWAVPTLLRRVLCVIHTMVLL